MYTLIPMLLPLIICTNLLVPGAQSQGIFGLLSRTMNSDKNVLCSGVSKCNVVNFDLFSFIIVCLYISLHHTLGPGKLVLL